MARDAHRKTYSHSCISIFLIKRKKPFWQHAKRSCWGRSPSTHAFAAAMEMWVENGKIVVCRGGGGCENVCSSECKAIATTTSRLSRQLCSPRRAGRQRIFSIEVTDLLHNLSGNARLKPLSVLKCCFNLATKLLQGGKRCDTLQIELLMKCYPHIAH